MSPRNRQWTLCVAAAVSVFAGGSSAIAAPGLAWQGPATDARWSVGANWSGGVAPAGGATVDAVRFDPESPRACDSTGCVVVDNDVLGLTIGELSITDPRLKLTGNPLTIGAGGLHAAYRSQVGTAIVATPLVLGADQTWTVKRPVTGVDYSNNGQFWVQGAITGEHALTIDMDDQSEISIQAPADVGALTLRAPEYPRPAGYKDWLIANNVTASGDLNAASGNAVSVVHTSLTTFSDLGAVRLINGGLRLGYVSMVPAASVRATALTMDASSQFMINISGAGTQRGYDYSTLSVSGPVEIAGEVRVNTPWGQCFEPKAGDAYVLLSTTSELTGTLAGDLGPYRQSIYPGLGCADASDRQLELRYDRTSMPRTVKLVVVNATDPIVTETPQPTPDPTPNPTPSATPSAQGTPAVVVPAASPTTAPPSPNVLFESAKLRLVSVRVKLTSARRCPKRVTVTVTSGARKLARSLPTRTSGSECWIRATTVKLTAGLAAARTLKITVSGKGVKTASTKVRRGA